MILHTILETTKALESESQAVDTFVKGMDAAAQLNLSMTFTRQMASWQEAAQGFDKQREQIEADHQAKMEELQQRGQATRIQIDAVAEQEKLETLQRKLEIALQQQSEFTDKTKQSSLMSKDDQISTLQSQIAEQQSMLDAYHSGTLVRAGENVSQLIALENKKKDAAISALDEQIAKQKQLQAEQEAQMYLQAFDMWAEQKEIPVERMIEMRTAIMEEYGLVDEGATDLVTDMVDEWDRWAQGAGISTDELVDYMNNVTDEQGIVLDNLRKMTAEEWVIKVKYEASGRTPGAAASTPGAGGGGESEFQHGGQFMVGERGPEVVTVQPINNNIHETVNINSPHSAAAYEERRRRERRLLARSM